MTSAERARASSPLDVALDVFRMRQYFDVVVRARDVASAVTRDLRWAGWPMPWATLPRCISCATRATWVC